MAIEIPPLLPDYVVCEPALARPTILETKAERVFFPLSDQDLYDICILSEKFDSEENIAGLAAPQINIAKRIIVVAIPDDPNLKKWRPDLIQTMAKTIWLNPSYRGIEEEGMGEDYEGCFSVAGIVASVRRYKTIEYEAMTREGDLVQGVARGFLARGIQHEIDHLDGILFIDLAETTSWMSIEEYRERRRATLSAEV